MLSISNPIKGGGREQYYLNAANQKYYCNEFEPAGQWYGEGAKRLDLSGEVSSKALKNLFEGFSAEGKHTLVQNAGRVDRQQGWDLTFSAPKSVSVLWALAPERIQHRIEQLHQQAVEVALNHLEEHCAFSRCGQGGRRKESAALTFATFRHSTSRANDPQLHTHAVLINVGLRADGSTGTLLSKPVFQEKMIVGHLYQKQLAERLTGELGLNMVKERVGYRVEGVPQSLCEQFSQRRAEIEKLMAKWGESDAVAAKKATVQTRRRKTLPDKQQLSELWRKTGEAVSFAEREVNRLIKQPAHDQQLESQQAKRVETQPVERKDVIKREARRRAKPVERPARKPKDVKVNEGQGRRFSQQSAPRKETVTSSEQPRQKSVEEPQQDWVRHQLRMSPNKAFGGVSLEEAMDKVSRRPRSAWLRVRWKPLNHPQPWMPPQGKWLHVRQHPLFPRAALPRLRRIQSPRVMVEVPHLAFGPRPRFKSKWWAIHRKRPLFFGEFRVQDRILFRYAPQWSPLHRRAFPAFRVTTNQSKSRRQRVEQVQSY